MNAKVLKELSLKDKKLAKLIKKVGPCTLEPQLKQSPYEALVEAVVYQQLTAKAASTIYSRVKALFNKKTCPRPEEILRTPDSTFRSAGLSGAKTKAIKDIAAKKLYKVIPTTKAIMKMDDATIIERLTTIHGVGPWTVEMMLIFKLGRPDVFPCSDYAIRKAYSLLYKKKDLPSVKELQKASERWSPYRTTVAWYLWRSIDLRIKKN